MHVLSRKNFSFKRGGELEIHYFEDKTFSIFSSAGTTTLMFKSIFCFSHLLIFIQCNAPYLFSFKIKSQNEFLSTSDNFLDLNFAWMYELYACFKSQSPFYIYSVLLIENREMSSNVILLSNYINKRAINILRPGNTSYYESTILFSFLKNGIVLSFYTAW